MTVSKKIAKNDSLTIPKSTRLKLNWKAGTSLDLIEQGDGTLLIRAHCPTCRFCGAYQDIRKFKDLYICKKCADELYVSVAK